MGYTFNPWRCTAGSRVKTSEVYWRQPLKWNREAKNAGERRRVSCASTVDVFENWQGQILDHRGISLYRFASGETLASDRFDVSGISERPLTLDDLRRDLFALIDATPWLDWLLLTKWPQNVQRMWPETGIEIERGEGRFKSEAPRNIHRFRPNVWLSTPISDQATGDNLLEFLDLCHVLLRSEFQHSDLPWPAKKTTTTNGTIVSRSVVEPFTIENDDK